MTRNVCRFVLVIGLLLALQGTGGSLAFAGDKEDIIGRWDNPDNEDCYIRFNADGTFKEVALLVTNEGNYRFLSKEVLEFDTPGYIYGKYVSELKYRLNGETLELKVSGNWLKYRRVR